MASDKEHEKIASGYWINASNLVQMTRHWGDRRKIFSHSHTIIISQKENCICLQLKGFAFQAHSPTGFFTIVLPTGAFPSSSHPSDPTYTFSLAWLHEWNNFLFNHNSIGSLFLSHLLVILVLPVSFRNRYVCILNRLPRQMVVNLMKLEIFPKAKKWEC